MSQIDEGAVAYHLLLDSEEVQIAGHALDLLISDEAHEPVIRALARQVLVLLRAPAAEASEPEPEPVLSIPLTAQQMKITHTAVKLLLNDSSREQQTERRLLWSILAKLPDEHVMRAIALE